MTSSAPPVPGARAGRGRARPEDRDAGALPGAAVRRTALLALATNVLIVVTGGAVRLTASGLGCPTWPSCTEDSLVNTPEFGAHGYIEFGNRLLTFAVGAAALAALVAALRHRPRRRDLVLLSGALLLGIPLQAVIGGFTVLTDLNPWVVMLHFLASMLLIGVATLLVRRSREPEGPRELVVPRPLAGLAYGVLAVLAVVLWLGTVVTGSGPHAGDAAARRTGLDPEAVAQLHVDAVMLLLGLSVALWVALHAVAAPAAARRAAAVLVAAELAQGLVGFVQHWLALPELLVGLHMLGAALLVVAAVHLATTLHTVPSSGRRGSDPPLERGAAPSARED